MYMFRFINKILNLKNLERHTSVALTSGDALITFSKSKLHYSIYNIMSFITY